MLEAYSRNEDVLITGEEFTSADGKTKVKIRALDFQVKEEMPVSDNKEPSTGGKGVPNEKKDFTDDAIPNKSGDKRKIPIDFSIPEPATKIPKVE